MESSFAIKPIYPARSADKLLRFAENNRSFFCDRDRMLEVGGEASVGGDRRPPVFQDPDVAFSHIHHRLDGENHSLPKPGASSRRTEVGDLRLFMQGAPDPMADEIGDDRISRF